MLHDGPIDVLVVGGGFAGLTLARQLERSSDLSVVVVDPRVPDPTERRLGESLTEVSSHYLEELGLGEHLAEQHIRKLALRFFLGRAPLSERGEFGIFADGAPPRLIETALPTTWQVHRGRLEHHLTQELAAPILRETARLEGDEVWVGERRIEARWVVDATARGLFGGPARDLGHAAQACWFWVEQALDVDTLGLPQRAAPHVRERSTAHLVGPEGWVWIIRLSDGSTSIGIVQPPGTPLDSPEAAMSWLARNEPELHAALGAPVGFAHLAWRSHTRPLLEPGRARVGDAAGFLDPLYSSGADVIAIGNDLIVACILGRIPLRRANTVFDGVREQYAGVYRGVFDIVRSPRAMLARTVWDQATYFGFIALLARTGALTDGLSDGLWHARAVSRLQAQVTECLVAWAAVDDGPAGHLDQPRCVVLNRLLEGLRTPPRGRALRSMLDTNLGLLEQLAVAIWARSLRARGNAVPQGPVNPYGLTSGDLDLGIRRITPDPSILGELETAWS
ncbi:MAG: hypothetical protein GY913_36045 [Proteobacteria bacterium]|nr:hypothetical protein [Pseudomonadota bacterium]MCP4922343.1 hypothetical protein [Pseudomonadota bacterium]